METLYTYNYMASQETGFEMSMLKQFDAELLIGQISYKQKADIYNVSKGYDTVKKECSTIERMIDGQQFPVHVYVNNYSKQHINKIDILI